MSVNLTNVFLAILVVTATCVVPCQASIGGQIVASIGQSIKNAFVSAYNYLLEAVKNAA